MGNTVNLGHTCPECNLRDTHAIATDYYIQFMNRLDGMFKWTGLPETIPARFLERYLMTNGWCGIGKAPESSQLYCFFGGLGDKPDAYYQPTKIILANPALGTKTYTIGEDVVWAKNDSYTRGIAQLVSRYAHLLAANDISINIAQVTSRMPFAITAETDQEVESAKEYIKQAEDGKIGIIHSKNLNNGLQIQPTETDGSGNYLKALIELHQYLKAQWSNDFGIGNNFNMKRERITEAEANENRPYLLTLVDEMLKYRKIAADEVNAMFGTSISVELDGTWLLEHKEQELSVDLMEEPNAVQSTGLEEQEGSEE